MSTASRALVLALAGLAGGCRERGSAFECSCAWLTDMDDEGTTKVRVCAPTLESAGEHAKNCAAAAPAPVTGCSCRAANGSEGCTVGGCAEP